MREIKFRVWNKEIKKMAYFNRPQIITDSPSTSLSFWLTNWKPRGETTYDDPNYCMDLDNDEPIIMQYTGLKDKNGKEIYEGDIVSLDGNMTADDSMGWLPNGWIFDEDDKYAIGWDKKLAGWVLKMPTKYDQKDEEVVKYLNQARGLLIDKSVKIIGNIYENEDLMN